MQYLLSLLPFLACPVGMGIMMWVMMRGNQGPMATTVPRRDAGEISATPIGRTRDEQVAELRARLSRLQAHQQAIADQITELDGKLETPDPV